MAFAVQGSNRGSLPDDSLLTSRFRESDIQSNLLSPRQPTRPNFMSRFFRRLKRRLGFSVKNQEEFFEREASAADQQLFERQMELIDDPVYICAQP